MREGQLRKTCKELGFDLRGIVMNDHDMGMARNYISPIKKGATALSIGTIAGIDNATGWGNIKMWQQAIANADSLTVGIAFFVFGSLIAINVGDTNGEYFRNIPNAWTSTFGKRNQEWLGPTQE